MEHINNILLHSENSKLHKTSYFFLQPLELLWFREKVFIEVYNKKHMIGGRIIE